MWLRSMLAAALVAFTPMTASAQEAALRPYSGLFCQSEAVGHAIGTTYQQEGIQRALIFASISVGLGECQRYDTNLHGRAPQVITSWVRSGRMLTLMRVVIVNTSTNETMTVYVFDVGDYA